MAADDNGDGAVEAQIVGGVPTTIEQIPWQVSLDIVDGSDLILCGGSIVEARWILTAAHCVVDGTGRQVDSIEVRAGSAQLASGGTLRSVEQIIVHPDYVWETDESDLALLALDEPLPLDGPTMRAVALPVGLGPEWPAIDTPAIISGWGLTSGGGSISLTLQSTEVTIAADPGDPGCQGWSPVDYNNLLMICSGDPEGARSTCQGDSGGPVTVEVSGVRYLAGVTSWGPESCNDPELPGVAVRVTSHLDWITTTIAGPPGPAAATDRVAGPDRYATSALTARAAFPETVATIVLASGEKFPDGLSAAGFAGAADAPVLITRPDLLPDAIAEAIAVLGADASSTEIVIVGGTAAVGASVEDQLRGRGHPVRRVAGPDRYETSAAVARAQAALAPVGVTEVDGRTWRTAIIATGADFPDALSAGAGAFANRMPLLLTPPMTLPAPVSAVITELGIERVLVMGGANAVSSAVETQLVGLGLRVDRIAGANRGETAARFADFAIPAAGGLGFFAGSAESRCLSGDAGPNAILLVNGAVFADALSAGPLAGVCRSPILVAGSPATLDLARRRAAEIGTVRAIGGSAAVTAEQLTAAALAAG